MKHVWETFEILSEMFGEMSKRELQKKFDKVGCKKNPRESYRKF